MSKLVRTSIDRFFLQRGKKTVSQFKHLLKPIGKMEIVGFLTLSLTYSQVTLGYSAERESDVLLQDKRYQQIQILFSCLFFFSFICCYIYIILLPPLSSFKYFIPLANCVCGRVYCFHVVRTCIRPSVHPYRFVSLIFNLRVIRPCIHIHIYRKNTYNKKVRAMVQFYGSYFPLQFLMTFE